MPQYRPSLLPLFAALGVLAGCSQPAVAPKPLALQERENSVRDWNTVAVAIADKMAVRGLLTARVLAPSAPQVPPVPPGRYYVNITTPGAAFLREVKTALEAEILSRGSTVSTVPSDSMVVNLDVNWVRWGTDLHSEGGWLTLDGLIAGGATVLAANGPYTPAQIFGMVAGAGLALDVINSLRPDTNVEAIWVATIVQGDIVTMQATAPVYVRARDVGLYSGDQRQPRLASFEAKPERTLVQLRYAP